MPLLQGLGQASARKQTLSTDSRHLTRDTRPTLNLQASKIFEMVCDTQEPCRLDKFLVLKFPETHRKFWKEHLTQIVRVNGQRVAPGFVVKNGDCLEIRWPAKPSVIVAPTETIREIPILFKDPYLIAVDKPAGVPCHPQRAEDSDTVVHAMLAKFPELLGLGATERDAGLIHRLDNETSGVLLFARSPEAWGKFSSLNRSGQIDKYYLAWVDGSLQSSGKIQLAVAHHPKKKNRMVAVAGEAVVRRLKARPALSEYEWLEGDEHASLLRVKIHKGSRHQIRVHLATLGHPILGDKVYGGEVSGRAARHLLHAERVEFVHPITGKATVIVSPTPPEMRAPLECTNSFVPAAFGRKDSEEQQ